jgi:hypothetical protein
VNETLALRTQLSRQVAHWTAAVVTVDNADNFASAQAWASVERYMRLELRKRLQNSVNALRLEVNGLAAQLAAAQTLEQLRLVHTRLLDVRRRYIQVETTLDFYGDAVNTRTNAKLAAILKALDLLAVRSMDVVLRPLGREVPPVLTYIDKGLGASILRAGVRLWDGGTLSPAAAIKMTRHNLYRPTSLIHETGHQVAHILGWTEEWVVALRHELDGRAPRALVDAWADTASEVVADIHAFVHCGYAAVAALHDVVASEEAAILRYLPGDPHPIPFIRVLLNVELCKRMFGAGPWDELAEAWMEVNSPSKAAPGTREFLQSSVGLLPQIADLCLSRRLRALGGKSIIELVDPGRVRPQALLQWAAALGSALYTSPHWAVTEPLRLLALSGYRLATDPKQAGQIAQDYETWMLRLSDVTRAA